MVNGDGSRDMNIREGRRRALSSREPWNRGNRTVHGFHGSTAHGSTVQPWNRAAAAEPWNRAATAGLHGSTATARLHGSTAEPWIRGAQ